MFNQIHVTNRRVRNERSGRFHIYLLPPAFLLACQTRPMGSTDEIPFLLFALLGESPSPFLLNGSSLYYALEQKAIDENKTCGFVHPQTASHQSGIIRDHQGSSRAPDELFSSYQKRGSAYYIRHPREVIPVRIVY